MLPVASLFFLLLLFAGPQTRYSAEKILRNAKYFAMATTLQNLFVTKLPRNITDVDLQQVFAEFRPRSAKVMLDAATGKSKGFGFVLFENIDEGQKACDAMNHRHVSVHGHSFTLNIFPSKHDGRTASMESNALYIRNIPLSMSKPAVEQFLANFGTMVYCTMREDHYGSPVWVVYVEYDCIDCAKSALQSLHGSTSYFFDSPAPVLAKFADCDEAKKERRRRREETRSQATPSCVFPSPMSGGSSSSSACSTPRSPRSEPASPPHSTSAVPTMTAAAPPLMMSMFTPAPMMTGNDGGKAATTTVGAPLTESDRDSPLNSQGRSTSVVYRHNPYGGTPPRVPRSASFDERGDVQNSASPLQLT